MQYLLIILLGILMFLSSPSYAEIIDESATLSAGNGDSVMREYVGLGAVQKAFDHADPRDSVIRYKYDPNQTNKIRMREYMSSLIVLPTGESIAGYALGDSKNFTFAPLKSDGNSNIDNLVNVFAARSGADTSLIIVGTSGNIYSFYLRNDSVKSKHIPKLVAYIDDPDFQPIKKKVAVLDTNGKEISKKEAEYLKSLPLVDPTTINHNYKSISGDYSLKPKRIFDDGYWTYFQFDDENLNKVKRLPTLYRVVDGYDNPVNTRIVKGTMIAETTNKRWTLRNGNAHLCIKQDD